MEEQKAIAPIKKPFSWFLLNGNYVKLGGKRKDGSGIVDPEQDAYVGVIKNCETGESKIITVEDPQCTIYITKPQMRANTIKRECELKSNCDSYRTLYRNIPTTIFNALNNRSINRPAFGYIRPKDQLSNPYVYGADIDYGVQLKYAYNKRNKFSSPKSYNVGHLDIETDVTGSEQIILITFMNGDGRTFVGILKEFYTNDVPVTPSDTKEDIERKQKLAVEDKVKQVHDLWEKVNKDFKSKLSDEALGKYEKSDPIQLFVEVCENEKDLINYIFNCIHHCKPDFITVWNIAYDIPYILNRLSFLGVDPRDVFCHPDVPKRWRMCRFKIDKGKKDSHITDLWHWLYCTDYTTWIDGMCLYGRLRKAKGRDASYKLNDIGEKEIGSGKLEFGEGLGHYEMQTSHKVEYTVYNIVDVLILRVMEMKNSDIFNMVMLSGDSLMDEFHHQSIQLKNSFYVYLDGIGMVPGSVGNELDQPWDKFISNKGGAVLNPDRSKVSVPSLKECDDVGRVCRFVCDLDVRLITLASSTSNRSVKRVELLEHPKLDNQQRSLARGTFRDYRKAS